MILWGVVFFSLDLLVPCLFPILRWAVNPMLLYLIFLGLRLTQTRWLWLIGGGLGLVKELISGSPFGGFTVSFALLGWLLGVSRYLVERGDPLLQGIWTGLFTLAHEILFFGVVLVVSPGIGWSRWVWGAFPLTAGIHGLIAAWAFPKMNLQSRRATRWLPSR